MKDENSVPAAQKMTDVSLSIFRSKFKKTRIQMIDYTVRDSRIGFDPEEAFRAEDSASPACENGSSLMGSSLLKLHLGSGTLIRSSVPLPARTCVRAGGSIQPPLSIDFLGSCRARCGGSQCAASYGSHMPYQLSIHGLANLEQ